MYVDYTSYVSAYVYVHVHKMYNSQVTSHQGSSVCSVLKSPRTRLSLVQFHLPPTMYAAWALSVWAVGQMIAGRGLLLE